MQHKTLISHFFNEEYLLPWWLNHHKQFFNKGIMIDYGSTDKSCNIIKKICPNWEIIQTQNKYFDSKSIDKEVTSIEKSISGWKICLNTTEFLVGDYGFIDSINNKKQAQVFIGNYIFVDNILKKLNLNKQIYQQVFNGFYGNNKYSIDVGQGDRSLRSFHNFNARYPSQGGRHFFGKAHTMDLCIFYYGYLLGIDNIINRKLQIQSKMSDEELKLLKTYAAHPNIVTKDSFISKIIKYQLPKCNNIKVEIDRLIDLQKSYLFKNSIKSINQTIHQIY